MAKKELIFQGIFDKMEQAIYISDPNTYEILYANEKLKDLFGSDIIGKNCHKIFQGADKPCPFCNNDRLFAPNPESPINWDHYNPKIDRWFHIIDQVIKWEGGKKVRFEMAEDITDKKKMELRLEESERKFHSLFMNMVEGFVLHEMIYDDDGKPVDYRMIDINPAFKKIFGIEKGDAIGRTSRETYGVADPPHLKKYARVVLTGEPEIFETYFPHIEKHFIIYAYRPAKGEFATIFQDITEKKQDKEALKKKEERYRSIVENLNEVVYILNEKAEIEYISSNVEKLGGFSISELIGRPFTKFVSPEDLKLHTENFKVLSGGGGPSEYRFLTKGGDFIWIRTHARPVFKEGRVVGVQGVLTDITKRKQAEEKLLKSEKRFKTLFMDSPVSIMIHNADSGELIDANPASLNKYGFSSVEELKAKMHDLWLNPPYSFEDALVLIQKTIREGPQRFEWLSKKLNGTTFWQEIFLRPILISGEKKVLATLIDINEKKQAELKLKELNQLKTDLLNRTSHELKTPLTSICGATELLLNLYGEGLNDDIIDVIDIIEHGNQRLKRLVNDLVDASRLESKMLNLDRSPTDLMVLIKNCVKQMNFLAEKRNIDLQLRNIRSELIHELDEMRFEQVIINLLSNAIKNTPPQGNVYIDIECENFEYINIIITDTGVGLTEDELSILFRRFGKIERFGKGLDVISEGSGLGLYISKEIVELHGGEIWAESEGRNKGARFIIRLFRD